MKLIRPFTLAALALVVTRTALAVPVGVELGAGTTAPLDVGAQLTLRLPVRVSVLAELGYLPAPYVALINSTVEAFGGWDETTSELIAESLNSSMVCRLGVGFQPLADWGWALHAGYAVAALGGGTSIAEVVEAATGEAVSAEIGRELPLHSTVHLGFVGTSYAWALREQWVLTVSLDYVQALASSSGIDLSPRREAGRRLVEALSAAVDGPDGLVRHVELDAAAVHLQDQHALVRVADDHVGFALGAAGRRVGERHPVDVGVHGVLVRGEGREQGVDDVVLAVVHRSARVTGRQARRRARAGGPLRPLSRRRRAYGEAMGGATGEFWGRT